MPNYFYAYHGPQQHEIFNYINGCGVSQEYRRNQTARGDLVFIIQNREGIYTLCGLFEITGHYEDDGRRPYRMSLEDYSRLPAFIELDDIAIGRELPQLEGNETWSNFQRHFCRQGVSFQHQLAPDVVRVLWNIIAPNMDIVLPDVDENIDIDLPDVHEEAFVLEGNQRLIAHLRRERNASIVRRKKEQVIACNNGILECEACGFNFEETYGEYGRNFCEVHHRIPLNRADGIIRTRLDDLAVLCSNCHRIIHRMDNMPDIEQLRNIIIEQREFRLIDQYFS